MGEIQLKHFLTKNGNKFVIRTALPEDADKVLAFIREIIIEAPYLLTTTAEFKVTIDQQKRFLQQVVKDNGKLAILAEYEGEIIGFLDFHNGGKQRIEHQGSFGMSVRKDFRNHGVGKALVSVLLAWAKENPLIERVCLEVFSENIQAISLYKNIGFLEEGLKRRAIKLSDQTYHDLILMAYFVE
ncbi:GNAT family N-acetyltransferase [Cytobacillus dafuensis]|uniref:GNAT family N-acetyltransferase n=1 Tax=Cytobacillus dafuensis TaxID=1742359 RepID=A0A5B8Z6C2_CYTDA|nr:GNAT family protein [Cytobacillus dafuensis]QED46936.1 GNAT family N-acetyltransferase [Cytobacillus dafuensis]